MSRQAIFANLRRALGPVTASKACVPPPPHPIPVMGMTAPADRVAHWQTALKQRGAEVLRVRIPGQIPNCIRDSLDAAKLPCAVRMGKEQLFAGLDWSGIAVSIGAAEADHRVGLSRAVAGIAETGTVMLASGHGNPATLAFLPELHIVVLEALNLKANMEEALAKLTVSNERKCLPRSVNFISGPSCTADIGGRLVYGAHGPKRLIVILVEEESAGITAD